MINIEKHDKIDIVSFSVSKINALITEDLREELSKVFDISNSKVIIDLSGVHYIDSSGFGCFLSIMKTARNNYGILKFAKPEPAIMDLFRTLHLHTVFQIYEDIESCMRSFS
ncbi:MAG TPA: STAS domain-containing protein [Bacteroidales bacterium]|jgi:anti-anti-sigma factor|nr:STAS domain-containing protein [Bacteroidales bacterium]